MSLDKRFQIIFIMHIVRIFLYTDSRIIGLMFSGGPFFFPGFCKGVRMPKFSSSSCSPVSAIRLKMIAICLWIYTGAYLMYSACVPSHPALFPFFSLEAAWPISSVVKGFSSLDGG